MGVTSASTERRLRLRRSLVGVAAGLTLAALGAGLGGWLGWRGAPALPDNNSAVALVSHVAGSAEVALVERQDAVFAYEYPGRGLSRMATELVGTDDYNSGYVGLSVSGGGDPAAVLAGMRERLLGQGWRVDSDGRSGLSAKRGELAMSADLSVLPVDFPEAASPQGAAPLGYPITIEIERSQPPLVDVLVIIGYALGLVAGWVVGRWVFNTIHERKGHRWTVGPAAGALGLTGLALLAPATILTTVDVIYSHTGLPDTVPPPAPWGDYLFFGVRGLSTLAFVLVAFVVVASVRQRLGGVRPVRPAAAC